MSDYRNIKKQLAEKEKNLKKQINKLINLIIQQKI